MNYSLGLMGRANPYKLVTDYDVVPEARGQKASWQLPHAIAMASHAARSVSEQEQESSQEAASRRRHQRSSSR